MQIRAADKREHFHCAALSASLRDEALFSTDCDALLHSGRRRDRADTKTEMTQEAFQSRLRNGANTLLTRWRAIEDRPAVQSVIRIARWTLFAAVVVYLIHRLTQVGWGDVIESLPATPWFYLFFVFRFLTLPVSEVAIYEIIWSQPLLKHFTVFVRKRVWNFAVMGYSGEAFLAQWALRNLKIPSKKIYIGVKDNNLLSALTSNLATVIIIVSLAASGGLQAGVEAFPGARWLFSLAFLSAAVLSIVVVMFRRQILALPDGVMPKLMSFHGARQALMIVLHAAMYSAALPGSPLVAWMTFIALQLVLSRVPFLPNQDIVFLGAALTLSPIVGAPEAAVAGMLVAEAGLSNLANFIIFVATAHHARTRPPANAEI